MYQIWCERIKIYCSKMMTKWRPNMDTIMMKVCNFK